MATLTKPSSSSSYTFGSSIEDYILGTISDDTIVGGAGSGASSNTVDFASDSADTMEGGLGDDWYVVNDSADVIIEYAGEGVDTVFTRVSYTLLPELENIVAVGSSGVTITGNGKDNTLDASQDSVADILVGGAGNDTYVIASTDVINADASGVDTVVASFTVDISSASASPNFAANSATVIENVTLSGSSEANITGNALNNRLTGNAGNNTINGGAGNDILDSGTGGTDSLDGGAGNDTYIIRTGSTATITDSTGIDTVQSFATITVATGIENVTLMGSSAANITGNSSNNVLTGNVAVNSIVGGDGLDTLRGGGGADILEGGNGNDVYEADASDTVTESSSSGGSDTVKLGGSDTDSIFALGNNVETLTMTGILALKASASGTTTAHTMTGNSANNTLTGGNGADTIDGGAGADSMAGGTGNDLYKLDNTNDRINDTGGTDSAMLSATSGTFTIGSGIETITLTGTTHIGVTLANVSNTATTTINGNSGNNTIIGSATASIILGNLGNDNITGGVGNDTINGGGGVDTMVGGAGDDKYYVDTATDSITDTSGTDTVESTASSYTLGSDSGVEKLTLAGTATTGIGNALANTITGNASANSLDGAAASDSINGGAGSDTIIGGAAADSLTGGADSDIFKWIATSAAGFATETGSTAGTNVTFAAGTVGDKVTDFASGKDDLYFAAAAVTNATGTETDTLGNIAKDGTVTNVMRFVHITDTVSVDEVNTVAGAVTVLNGLTTSAVAIGDSFIAAMDNDTDTYLYYVKQVSTADTIAVQDVTLIGVVNGVTIADGDFVSF